MTVDHLTAHRYLDDMATTEQLVDADAFLARPEGVREELIDGRIVVNEPTARHQAAMTAILTALKRWIDEGGGHGHVSSPLDLRISERDVLAPDVLWYADRKRVALDDPAQREPPDLVVEVRSASTWAYDIGLKRERYERWGVRELWLVDTHSRSVLVHRRRPAAACAFDLALEVDRDDSLRSPLLPGFELPVTRVFEV